jgi:hypothetical protein
MWRRLKWVVVALILLLAGGTVWAIVEMRRADHFTLVVLSRSTIQPAAWIFEQGLFHLHPTPEEIQQFNREAGAVALITEAQEPQAHRLLAHYIAAGLDINRPDLRSPLLVTALHYVTQYDKAWYVRVLLEHGARADVRDAKGETPLDRARKYQRQFPDDPEAAEKVRLLEAAEQAQRRAAATAPAMPAPR